MRPSPYAPCLALIALHAWACKATDETTKPREPSATAAVSASIAPSAPQIAELPARADAAAPDCSRIFGAPSGGDSLCSEHVMGTNAEIEWHSYAFKEPRVDIEARYRTAASACHFGLVTKPPSFTVSEGNRRLSVHDAADKDYPSCAKGPEKHHLTVIVVSQKFDR